MFVSIDIVYFNYRSIFSSLWVTFQQCCSKWYFITVRKCNIFTSRYTFMAFWTMALVSHYSSKNPTGHRLSWNCSTVLQPSCVWGGLTAFFAHLSLSPGSICFYHPTQPFLLYCSHSVCCERDHFNIVSPQNSTQKVNPSLFC